MSDNFVRRNLKRRHKGVKLSAAQVRKKQRTQRFSANDPFRSDEDSTSSGEKGDTGLVNTAQVRAANAATLSVDFSDPLHRSMAFLSDSRVARPVPAVTPSLASVYPQYSAEETPKIRGLHVAASTRRRDVTLADALADSRLLTSALLHVVQQAAPICPSHGVPTVVRTVRKTGSRHRGRRFFGCSYDGGDETRCDFFCWVEDHAPLLHLLPPQLGSAAPDAVSQWIDDCVDEFRQTLIRLEKDELVREARSFNRRRLALLGTCGVQ